MGLTEKEQRVYGRQLEILRLISKPGGMSCTRLADKFTVSRGTIINDIRDLRKMGYPIQTSMVVEQKMYSASFELPRIPEIPS